MAVSVGEANCTALLDDAMATEVSHTDMQRSSQLAHQLNAARKAELFTDVTLAVDGGKFTCHRVMLVSGSPYFRAVFQHDPQAKQKTHMDLPGLTARGLDALLDYMYTSQVIINTDNVIDVLEAADFLQFRPIVKTCSTFLLQHMNAENCLQLHLLADAHLCQALAQSAHQYSIDHFDEVCRSSDFIHLAYTSLLSYLQISYLYIAEESVLLQEVCRWLQAHPDHLVHADKLLRHINLCSISHIYLSALIQEYPWLEKSGLVDNKRDEKCVEANTKTHLPHVPQSSVHYELILKQTPSQKSTRPHEVLVLIPRETISMKGKHKTDILYFCQKETKWKVLTHIPFKDRYLYSIVIHNNNIYVTGGEQFEVPVNLASCYNVEQDSWVHAPAMLKTRANHSSASTAARVFVIGGKGPHELRSDGEEYNPQTSQWTLLPDILGSHGSQLGPIVEGIGRCAVVPLDGKLYILGGTASTTNRMGEKGRFQYGAAQYYDIADKTWHLEDKLTQHIQRENLSIGVGDCLSYKGLILLIHETTKGKNIKVYNPSTQTMTDFIRTHGQHRFGGYIIHRDVLYCVGGVAGMFGANDMVHYYNMNDNAGSGWKMMTPLPAPYSHHTCGTVFKTCT